MLHILLLIDGIITSSLISKYKAINFQDAINTEKTIKLWSHREASVIQCITSSGIASFLLVVLDCQIKTESRKLCNFTSEPIICVWIRWIFKFENYSWTNVNCFALWQDWFDQAVYRIIIKLAEYNEFNSGVVLLPYFCSLLIQIKTRRVDRNSQ
jgi:hypothetical protein